VGGYNLIICSVVFVSFIAGYLCIGFLGGGDAGDRGGGVGKGGGEGGMGGAGSGGVSEGGGGGFWFCFGVYFIVFLF